MNLEQLVEFYINRLNRIINDIEDEGYSRHNLKLILSSDMDNLSDVLKELIKK